uniref:Putative secreted protein n=1 Tax=Panstrongylus lignarius TaxID=156445 RepID=A0A224Y688_9HEMI
MIPLISVASLCFTLIDVPFCKCIFTVDVEVSSWAVGFLSIFVSNSLYLNSGHNFSPIPFFVKYNLERPIYQL